MLVSPFHSAKLGTNVHHDDNECWDGNNIEPRYFRQGTGNHRLCGTCRDIQTKRRDELIKALANAKLRNR